MIRIFHRFNLPKNGGSLKPASLRDRVISQLIDSIFLSAICSVLIFLFSGGRIYSTWVAPIIPQFLLEVEKGLQTDITNWWWGGHFFSIHMPYGKDIFLHYPAPLLWFVYCLYYTLFTFFVGQTPGKMMKRLVILNESRNKPTLFCALCRWGGYYLSLIPLGFGFWGANFGKNHKTWHDKICGTEVYYFE